MDVIYSLTGFIVGFIIGLTGVGGGSLLTPKLMHKFSIKPAVAVGTDLLYA
ncbi:MAG: TSUP family transporter, partial [Gammaproteobacteria bacterium]